MGADKMQRTVRYPALIIVLQGLVVLFVVSSDYYVRRHARAPPCGRRRTERSHGQRRP
ncbi:MAG: hypothetical protein R2854_13765 [Caldilineaceae bacterium]